MALARGRASVPCPVWQGLGASTAPGQTPAGAHGPWGMRVQRDVCVARSAPRCAQKFCLNRNSLSFPTTAGEEGVAANTTDENAEAEVGNVPNVKQAVSNRARVGLPCDLELRLSLPCCLRTQCPCALCVPVLCLSFPLQPPFCLSEPHATPIIRSRPLKTNEETRPQNDAYANVHRAVVRQGQTVETTAYPPAGEPASKMWPLRAQGAVGPQEPGECGDTPQHA